MKKKLSLIVFLFLILNLALYSFDFGPLGFDKRIDNGAGYGEFSLRNHDNHPVRYKIKIIDSGKKNNISKYVSVYPKVVTIPAQGEKMFKVFVDPPKNIKNGEYDFIIAMNCVGVPFLGDGKIVRPKPELTMEAAVDLEMFCYAGPVKKYFEIKNSKFYSKLNKDGKREKYYKAEVINDTGRGYEIGVGFYDVNNTLMDVKSRGRFSNGGEMNVNILIPSQAKKIVFYDYNNTVVVGQQIKIK